MSNVPIEASKAVEKFRYMTHDSRKSQLPQVDFLAPLH